LRRVFEWNKKTSTEILSPKTIKILANTAWVICLLVAIVLGFKNLREPDIWWQLRTGEWIIQHHTVPFKDIFSFTYEGTPWINVKWGFEVLMQCMAYIGGPEFTPVLQCIADILILVFVLKIYNFFRRNILGIDSKLPSPTILFSAFLLLVICAFRFIGRPEMASHVMAVVFLFFILSDHFKSSRKILWLIPLQILWANLHEAYGTGTVMVVTAAVAAWMEYFLHGMNIMTKRMEEKKPSKNKKKEPTPESVVSPKPIMPKWLSITAIGVILAPVVHPYGLTMITHPFEIFSQVESNKFTSELLGYMDPLYWNWEAYANIILFGLGLIFLFLKTSSNKEVRWIFWPVNSFGLAYCAILLLFFYLSLTAYRNIPFFIITVIPLFANGLDVIFVFLKKRFAGLNKQGWTVFFYGALIVLGGIFYVSITTGKFYKDLEQGHDSYGLKVNAFANPIGAADYLRDHNIKGNGFSDFLVSSYLLWDLRPDFKTFIDLRDLDVFPADFFEHVNLLEVQPKLIENIDKVAHFKYAVIFRRQFEALHSYLAANPDWRGVYADPVAAIYIKKDTTNAAIMALFNNVKGEIPFHAPPVPHNSSIARIVSEIFWPAYNPDQTEKVDIDIFAADYYKSIHHYESAISFAKKAANNNISNGEADDMLGNIYLDLASADTSKSKRENDFNLANEAFNKALGENKKDDAAYLGLGTIALYTGDPIAAESSYIEALKYNRANYLTWWDLANCESNLCVSDRPNAMSHLQERLKYLKKAYHLNQDQRVRFYLGIVYGQTDDCDNCRKYLDENTMRYPGIPASDRKLAKEMRQNCGKD